MKMNKKAAMIISFTIGTLMFATTAFAEVNSKSGYDELKDSLKHTAENCTSKFSSFTVDSSFVMRDNGAVIYSRNMLNKYDASKKSIENTSETNNGTTKSEELYYKDKNVAITHNTADSNIYHVTNITDKDKTNSFLSNPFKESQTSDIEKIVDTAIGNLKDSISVAKKTDGTRELSTSLSENQIPSLINAVTSFKLKQDINNQIEQTSHLNTSTTKLPQISKDVFVKDVQLKVITDKDGSIQSVLASGAISGKDNSGNSHLLVFELSLKIKNINSTVVNKPDLSGKKVDESTEKDYTKLSNPTAYLGKYKNDITIEKDSKFEKIGERFIEIEEIDSKHVKGKYYEEYLEGYKDYSSNAKSFNFDGNFGKDNFNAPFNTSSSGNVIKGNIYISPDSANINFNVSNEEISNPTFSKVFNWSDKNLLYADICWQTSSLKFCQHIFWIYKEECKLETVIEINNLTKLYKNDRGIRNINLKINKGDIFGFLGPNGAGKSTTMKIMTGLVKPDSGDVKIFGHSILEDFQKAMENVSCIIETANSYEYLTAFENLKQASRYYENVDNSRIDEVLNLLGLSKYKDEKTKKFSLGMKQRLGIAAAILSKPKIIILDEPLNGLDVEGMIDIRNIIKDMAQSYQTTFFISSHLIHDIEMTCSKIGLLYNGALVNVDTTKNILKNYVSLENYFVSEVNRNDGI